MRRLQNYLALNLLLSLLLIATPVIAAGSRQLCRASGLPSNYNRDRGQAKQPSAAGAERFAGTWKGQFKGQSFAILTLKVDGQKLVGTIGFSQISINREGEIEKVSGEVSAQTPIYDLKPAGDTLLFKHKDDDDVDEMELRLKNDKDAELRFLNAAAPSEGLKAPKPLHLTKEPDKK